MATRKKTSIKPATRAKGQLRIDQQAALKKLNAQGKGLSAAERKKLGSSFTAKQGAAALKKAAAPAKKKKQTGALGLAHRLRSRFPK